MAYAQAKTVDTDIIPVIDITPLRDGSDPTGVARALHAASQGLGFIYVSGHGIPDDIIAAARRSAYRLFRAPEADKETIRVSERHRGWLGRGGARMQDDARADLKESFIWGYQDDDGNTPEDHALRGANKWPAFVSELQSDAMGLFPSCA